MFVIEDERHAEPQGEFSTIESALAELRRRATVPWDQAPNCAPCTSWRTCGRVYEIIEYETSETPWREIRRLPALEVSAIGTTWLDTFEGARNDA